MKIIFYSFYTLGILCAYASSAQSIFQPGDIAIIGYNFKDPDAFSFVFLEQAEEGTIVHITDCGYNAPSNAFRSGEGLLTYTVPEGGRKIGDVVTYPNDASFTKQGIAGFFGLSIEGDQLLIFQGTVEAPTFIYALNVYDETWQTASTTNNNSSLPPGLTNGLTAIAHSKLVNGRVDCSKIYLEPAYFLEAVALEQYWERNSLKRYDLPDQGCDYTILPLKEKTNMPNEDPDAQIFLPGYLSIQVLGPDGCLITNTTNIEEAFNVMSSGKLYFFKVYYADRLEVRKFIR